jgi:Alpha/beta-hydrolase family
VLGPDLLVQRPSWLADGQRGRGVPQTMRWQPLGTFIQTGMDAMNAMLLTPGEFASFGHDYRADMAAFVRDAYGLPEATDEQLERIEQVLRSLELERNERIKAEAVHTAPPAPAYRADHDDLAGGVPLRSRRSPGMPRLRRAGDRERGDR